MRKNKLSDYYQSALCIIVISFVLFFSSSNAHADERNSTSSFFDILNSIVAYELYVRFDTPKQAEALYPFLGKMDFDDDTQGWWFVDTYDYEPEKPLDRLSTQRCPGLADKLDDRLWNVYTLSAKGPIVRIVGGAPNKSALQSFADCLLALESKYLWLWRNDYHLDQPQITAFQGETPIKPTSSFKQLEQQYPNEMFAIFTDELWWHEDINIQHITHKTKMFLQHGLDPNMPIDGSYPLHTAAEFNLLPVAQLLLDAKAQVNAVSPIIEETYGGETALHHAMENAHTDDQMLRLLLNHRANPNIQNAYGNTALHIAADYDAEYRQYIPLLLKVGADVHIKNKEGLTPLLSLLIEARPVSYDETYREKDLLALQALIKAGANLDEIAPDGGNTLWHASGYSSLEKFIKSQGVKKLIKPLDAYGDDIGYNLQLSIEKNDIEIFNQLIRKHTFSAEQLKYAVLQTISADRIDMLEQLLRLGADLTTDFSLDHSLSQEAYNYGHYEISAYLKNRI